MPEKEHKLLLKLSKLMKIPKSRVIRMALAREEAFHGVLKIKE